MLKKLKRIIKLRGYAYAAYMLGYRDTTAIKKWIIRKKIPLAKLLIVQEFVNKTVH